MRYLLIQTAKMYIPGDERSRSNPGHGYPDRMMEYPENKFFDSEEALLDYISKSKNDLSNFKIYELGSELKIEKITKYSLTK